MHDVPRDRPRKPGPDAVRRTEPERAGRHPAHPVFELQRSAGNRAVSSALAGQMPRLQRFNEMEHKAIGDAGAGGAPITLPGGLTVSFGDVTALAGDYFGSAEQLRSLAAKPGNGMSPGTRDEVEFVLHVKLRGDKKASDFGPDVATAVDRRYYALAGTNVTHFTQPGAGDAGRSIDELAKARGTVPDSAADAYEVAKGTKVPVTNVGSYRANHESALRAAALAGAAGARGGPGAAGATTMSDALLFEAFSSHFLTDAYAAGHLRTPRAAVAEWWNPKVPMFWTNLQLWMAEVMAQHLNDHSVAGYVQSVQQLYEAAQETLRDLGKKIPALTFGDAVAGAMHDMDNEKGVTATVGSDVAKLVGDGEILDAKGRALVAGVPTAEKAAAGVRASLKEVHDAFAAGAKGAAPDAVLASIRLPDGLFRAEQLWPRALADTDPRQITKSLDWQVAGPEELFANARMRAALARFAHEKADTMGSQVTLEDGNLKANKELALKEAVLDKLKSGEAGVIAVLRDVINYTPGSATRQTGGVLGHDEDDDAVTYYETAKAKGALGTLTLIQRKRLIQLVLDGSTTGAEDTMVADLLTSNPAHATSVLDEVGWRRVWDDLSGDDLQRVVDGVGPAYWAGKSLARKKEEVAFLAAGRTNDVSQRAIIMILRTCASPAQVREIDDSIDWPSLDFDLTGEYQDELDRLKK